MTSECLPMRSCPYGRHFGFSIWPPLNKCTKIFPPNELLTLHRTLLMRHRIQTIENITLEMKAVVMMMMIDWWCWWWWLWWLLDWLIDWWLIDVKIGEISKTEDSANGWVHSFKHWTLLQFQFHLQFMIKWYLVKRTKHRIK